MTTLEEGTRSVDGCVCQMGFYRSGNECVACGSMRSTARAGSASEEDCVLDRPAVITIAAVVSGSVATAFVCLTCLLFARWRSREYEQQRNKRMDNMLQNGLASLKEFGFPMVLMGATQFLELTKEELLLFHEGLRDQGILLTIDTLQGVRSFKDVGNVIIFFSYQWQSFSKTGPNDAQLDDMRKALKELCGPSGIDISKAFVWLDAYSIPQCAEHLRRLAANTLYMYASLSSVMVIIAPDGVHEDTGEVSGLDSYLLRVWTRIEQLAHFCANGSQNMCYMRKTGLEYIKDDWIEGVVNIFDGKLTCCRQKHPNGGPCDREGMVPMLLGMYFEVHTAHIAEYCPAHTKKVWDIINSKRDTIFPKDFIYEGSKSIEKRELFGDLLTRASNFVTKDPDHAATLISRADSHVRQPSQVSLRASSVVEVIVT
jgi:hypothetical protein